MSSHDGTHGGAVNTDITMHVVSLRQGLRAALRARGELRLERSGPSGEPLNV